MKRMIRMKDPLGAKMLLKDWRTRWTELLIEGGLMTTLDFFEKGVITYDEILITSIKKQKMEVFKWCVEHLKEELYTPDVAAMCINLDYWEGFEFLLGGSLYFDCKPFTAALNRDPKYLGQLCEHFKEDIKKYKQFFSFDVRLELIKRSLIEGSDLDLIDACLRSPDKFKDPLLWKIYLSIPRGAPVCSQDYFDFLTEFKRVFWETLEFWELPDVIIVRIYHFQL